MEHPCYIVFGYQNEMTDQHQNDVAEDAPLHFVTDQLLLTFVTAIPTSITEQFVILVL